MTITALLMLVSFLVENLAVLEQSAGSTSSIECGTQVRERQACGHVAWGVRRPHPKAAADLVQ